MNREPNIVLGDFQSHGLPSDSRPAYRDWVQVPCVNVKRAGFSGWLGTDPAQNVRADVSAYDREGAVVFRDQAVFVGGEKPSLELPVLYPNDSRFALLAFNRIGEYSQHPFVSTRRLRPATYFTGGRAVIHGQWEQSILPPGALRIVFRVMADNIADPVEASTDLTVDESAIAEPPFIFSLPADQPRSDELYEKLNVEVRASRQFSRVDNVRLMATLDGEEFPMQWSVDDGNMDGSSETTLFPEHPTKVLVAARALSASGVNFLGGASVGPNQCYLTDVSFRVHKQPKRRLSKGEHRVLLKAISDEFQSQAEFVVVVPESSRDKSTIATL